MGSITNISLSCINIFKISKHKIINTNIHDIFPDFLADAHRKMLIKWVNRGSSQHIGKINEIYFITKDKSVFQGIIYLKAYATC